MWEALQSFAQQVVVQVLIPLATLLLLMLASILVSWLSKHLNLAWAEKAWNRHVGLVELLVAAAEQHPSLRGKSGHSKRMWVAKKLMEFLGEGQFDPALFDVLVEAAVHKLKEGESDGVVRESEEEVGEEVAK